MDRDRLSAALAGQYRVARELGKGGMSRVWLAEDRALGRQVVVKVLAHELAGGVSIDRFRREIQLAARLQHACIVPLLSAGDAGGIPYFTMPFVDGDSLRERIEHGRLAVPEAVRVTRDIAEALSYAHDHGIVHRDIKPENVLLTRHHALVTDFGVAKAVDAAIAAEAEGLLTGLGVTLGTPAYMAPEQAAADPEIDHRADLYSLGVVMFEMLTGKRPFADRAPAQLLAAHAIEQPAFATLHQSGVPRHLVDLVTSLLAKDPNDRPQSAEAVLQLLDSAGGSKRSSRSAWAADGAVRTKAVATALLLAAAAVGGLLFLNRPTGLPAAPLPTLAVLPLVNLGNNAGDEYLSDGLSDQLISALSKVDHLKVAARTSSFAFKGRNDDVRAIAARLGVSNVLGGSVQRAGNRLRVTVQLTSAATGFNVWSESYDREYTDVLAVQDEITWSIVAALKGRLTAHDSSVVRATVAANAAAYDSYLKALYQFNRRGRDGLTRAAQLFHESLQEDPTYAPAYAGLAMVHLITSNWLFATPRLAVDSARFYAQRAISLDPRSAEAQTALGGVLCQEFDFTACERTLRQAMELNPSYWVAPYALSFQISPFGRFNDAFALFNRARELDPLNPQIYAAISKAHYLQRTYDDGLRELEAVRDLPDAAVTYIWRSYFLRAKGEGERAVVEARRATELSGGSPNFQAEYARALLAAGQRDSSLVIIRSLERLSNRPSFGIAMYYANARDEQRTVAWLDSAYSDRSDWITMLVRAADFDPYRRNARVAALIKELGM